MPLYMEQVLASEPDRNTSSVTEYRRQFMSPRREDYIPHVSLPKLSGSRPVSRSRSFLSADPESNAGNSASEYRFRYPNHQPKRPYCFHAQPSHVFDFVPIPTNTKPRPTAHYDGSPKFDKDTEYQERFPNYRAFVPIQELTPPHLSSQANVPSPAKLRKETMTRSQYFHEMALENQKLYGGQAMNVDSEQRSSFQWPYHPRQAPAVNAYTNLNPYETIPPIRR